MSPVSPKYFRSIPGSFVWQERLGIGLSTKGGANFSTIMFGAKSGIDAVWTRRTLVVYGAREVLLMILKASLKSTRG
jgi:hypothetical protein